MASKKPAPKYLRKFSIVVHFKETRETVVMFTNDDFAVVYCRFEGMKDLFGSQKYEVSMVITVAEA